MLAFVDRPHFRYRTISCAGLLGVPMRVRSAPSQFAILIGALILATSMITSAGFASAATATPIQVYGSWLCGNDECTWGTVRNMTDFDTKNHWLVDRGDGTPSVN